MSDKQDAASTESHSGEPRPRSRWPLWAAGVVVAVFIAVVLIILLRPKTSVRTDDAYVSVHYATVAPRVSGQIASVNVDDNQLVRQGQILATLDPRDYRTAVTVAEANLEKDRASVSNAGAEVERQPAQISQATATLESAQAQLRFSRQNAQRYQNLAATGAGTAQQGQSTQTQLAQDAAAVRSAQAQLQAAKVQLHGLEQQKSALIGTVHADEARLEQARLNLSYTQIVAPVDGMVGQRSVEVGNYVTPGAAIMAVVPLQSVYIEANYRETDLRHVVPGQHVRIHVDAYDIGLDGTVDSVPPATGTTFSPIQPNNATGNFTKIVQRLPVKILVNPGQRLANLLRVGMSVETTIDTGTTNVADEQQQRTDSVTAH